MSSPLPAIDAEEILQLIDSMRRQVPGLEGANDRRAHAEAAGDWYATAPPSGVSAEDMQQLMIEFDYLSVGRALQEFVDDLDAEIERRRQNTVDQCLDIYYATKELVEQGHTELIPHVEAMERAYRQDYGQEIPPKARRRQ